MYIYLSSDASEKYFPDNKPFTFRTRLDYPAKLYGEWEIALVDISLPRFQAEYKPEYVVITSSICNNSFYNNSQSQILDRLYASELRPSGVLRIPRPKYIRINTETAYTIDLHIFDEQGSHPSFRQGVSHCTLHIRKCLS